MNMEQTGYSDGLPVIRQKPGGANALGKVKFIFPNIYNIYFHDTPSKLGNETINTIPIETLEAFNDHENAENSLGNDLDNATHELAQLKELI